METISEIRLKPLYIVETYMPPVKILVTPPTNRLSSGFRKFVLLYANGVRGNYTFLLIIKNVNAQGPPKALDISHQIPIIRKEVIQHPAIWTSTGR